MDVRGADEWAGGYIPGAVLVPLSELAEKIGAAAPGPVEAGGPLLRDGETLAGGGRGAHRGRLRPGGLDRRRNRRLARSRLREQPRTHARARPARALQPPPADPGGRRGRPAEAARVEHPADRRRRPRLARGPLPGRGRRRNARDRRRRRRGRVEPPAAGAALHRASGRAQGEVGKAHPRGAEPRRRGPHLRGAPHLRERRRHPRPRAGT